MSAVPTPVLPPFVRDELREALDALAKPMGRDELLWASGYFAGLAAADRAVEPLAARAARGAAQDATDAPQWLILYATETGNSRRVAEALEERMRREGIGAERADLRDFEPKSLRRVRHAAFVVATHGLGDPPEGTEAFFDYWMSDRAPRLEHLSFCVLALGDSSYDEFCGTGREWDLRLEALGAARVHARVDCDVDFETTAEAWRSSFVAAVAAPARREPRASVSSIRPDRAPALAQVTRDAPFTADVLVNQRITGRGSTKDVRHIELSLADAGVTYEPGDSIGVWPQNSPDTVAAVLELARLPADAQVRLGDETTTLQEALGERLEITQLGRKAVETYAERASSAQLRRLLRSNELPRYLATHQLVDLLAAHPAELQAQELVDALRKLTPRLYSAASSPAADPEEVHLTVGVLDYERFGRPHTGAASGFLARAAEVPVYVEPNDHFRLPRDGAARVIMIGAGTGIAPFRAFLQHRRELGAAGPNWLIYGDRTMRDDFLYQLEWLRYRQDGGLARLDAAFSREQAQKIYVQHRIAERAAELYDWLEHGAHVYVCGDAEGMAPAVHAALADAVSRIGGRSADDAEDYLRQLKAAKRYQRDVY